MGRQATAVAGTWLRLGGFGLVLALAVGAGFEVGHLRRAPEQGGAAHAADSRQPAGQGVMISAAGYTLSAERSILTAGQASTLRLHVTGPDGQPLLRYGPVDGRLIHLALVRRDLAGYQTPAPVLQADGTWSVPITLPQPGSWRLLADFTALSGTGTAVPLALGLDLSAAGDYAPATDTAAQPAVSVDGYTVSLAGGLRIGHPEPLLFTIREDGQPVTDLDTYPGGSAHLTVLRAGDLAQLPAPADPDNTAPATPARFWVSAPSPGRYGLYLDFSTDGTLHTAAFTLSTPAGSRP